MDKNLISVIIPAHNCTAYIEKALDSALMQDVPLEVIVIDDLSTDDLDSVMAPYLSDTRVRYYKNEVNLGASKTRNRGVSLANGNFVAFLDADDYWAQGKLQKQLRRLEETGCVLCASARELMRPDGSRSGYVIPVPETLTFSDMLRQNYINCSSVVLRTEVAKEFPMHNDDCHEDYLMWLEILGKYEKAAAVNEPLLIYRVSNTGKSGSKLHSARLTLRTYRKMGFSPLKTLRCFVSYTFGGIRKYFRWFVLPEKK